MEEMVIGRWLSEAVMSRKWCDVSILCGGRHFWAHRLVLSTASPFIRGLLLSRPSDDIPTTIVFADFSYEIVEALLQYIYSGEVSVLPEHVEDFLALSQALKIHVDTTNVNGMNNILKSTNLVKSVSSQDLEIKSNGDVFESNNKIEEINSSNINREYYRHKRLDNSDKRLCNVKNESYGRHLDLEVLIRGDKISKNESPIFDKNYSKFKSSLNYESSVFSNMLVQSENLHKENHIPDSTLSEIPKQGELINVDKNPRIIIPICDNSSESSCELIESSSDIQNYSTNPGILHQPIKYSPTLQQTDAMLPGRKYHCNVPSPFQNMRYEDNPSALNLTRHASYPIQKHIANTPSSSQLPNLPNVHLQRLHQASNLRNDKLVRPIPYLMPIDSLSSIFTATETKIQQKKVPDLLDLTSLKGNLRCNSNSAFERVNNIPAHSNPASPKIREDNLIMQARLMNEDLRKKTAILNQTNPLRLGFDHMSNMRKCLKSDGWNNGVLPTYANDKDINPVTMADKIDLRTSRRIPHNRVMESPWSVKGPICYRRRTKWREECETIVRGDSSGEVRSITSNVTVPDLSPIKVHVEAKNCDKQFVKSNDNNNNSFEQNQKKANQDAGDIKVDSCERKNGFIEGHNDGKNSALERNGNFMLAAILDRKNPGIKYNPNVPDKNIDHDISSPLNVDVKIENDEASKPIVDVIKQIPDDLKVEDPLDDVCALKCPSCFKMFTSRATLAAHAATHVSRARYRCDQCDKSFSQLRNYKYHVSVHKGTKEFAATCNVCGKYFNDRGYLSSHMKIHRNRKEYQCPHCPKSFNQRVAYNMHVRIHTGVKPHQCEACGKAFSRKMLLKQHSRTHSGEKPYACSACGKRFADRSNMTLHMRLHSGVKPFSCNLCPKSFTKKHHLKTHLNYHTGNKPYACTKCGLTFSQSSNMRTHMKKCSATTNIEESNNSTDAIVT